MAAHLPGAQTDPDGMWSPALARGLIRDDVLRSMRCCDGYTDLLGLADPARRSLAARAMRSPRAVALHNLMWRPAITCHENTALASCLGGQQRVLDVACGQGDVTRLLASQLRGDGFVIGLDDSTSMIQRAVERNSQRRGVYMRADALSLPFNDAAFDVVCCFGALHFLQEPFAVLQEMVRVLCPGGRIAVMTTYGRESVLVRASLELGATICGVRVFDRVTLPAFFAAAGLVEIDQQLHRLSQFVSARRPAQIIELERWRRRSVR